MRSIALALLVIGLGACGSRRVNFPVDDNKVLSTVSSAELQEMCNSVISYSKDALNLACLSKGISAKFKQGGSEQSCQTTVSACQAEMQSKPLSCTLMDPKQLEGCTATVGEYEICINDSLEMISRMEGRLSCSISQSDLMSLAAEMQSYQSMPPSCQTLSKKCPKLMGSSSDSSGG
jgi:hypothetical protein